jgi:hypothetical protein
MRKDRVLSQATNTPKIDGKAVKQFRGTCLRRFDNGKDISLDEETPKSQYRLPYITPLPAEPSQSPIQMIRP